MSKLFLVNVDLNGNEIDNVVLQPLASAPQNPTIGRIYYDTSDHMLKTYDGTNWSASGAVASVNGKVGVVVLSQDDIGNGTTYKQTHNDLTDALVTLINGALQKSGGTMSGAIAMGSNKITGLANGTASTDAATVGQIPTAGTSNPNMDGTSSAGSATTWSKSDHVHPTDTSRQAKITASGILKGNGSGGVSAATAGTDYGTYSKPSGGIPESDLASALQTKIDGAVQSSEKGASNGVAELDANGKIPSSQLPSSVDEIIEGYYYNSKFYEESSHTTEITGEASKIYVDLSTDKTYRWSGTAYVEISASLALGETSSTAYRGDRGKTAYDHSQLTSGNPHNVSKSDVGLGNVDNTSDATKKTNFTGTIASGDTGFVTGGDAYTTINGALHVQTGTISTSATTASVAYSGTFVNAYAEINGSICVVDIARGTSSVTFSVAAAPSSAITCTVVSFSISGVNGR